MSDHQVTFTYSYRYLEDIGLMLVSKSDRIQTNHRRPPRVQTKFQRYYADTSSPFQQLTSPIDYGSFPSPLYDNRRGLSYHLQLFKTLESLGEGSFGTVFRVYSREDGKEYALKKAKEPFRNRTHRQQRLEEVKWQERLSSHKNILKLYNAWEERNVLYMQMELCKMPLSNYSESCPHEVTEPVVWDVMVDMLSALMFIHGQRLLHLDVKLDNILIGFDGLYKLGDFSLIYQTDYYGRREPVEGDPRYVAPEVLFGTFTEGADIFSLGMCLLELACYVSLPSAGSEWQALRQNRLPRTQTRGLSQEFRDTLSLLVTSDYRIRPSAVQLFEHPVVKKRAEARKKDLQYKKISNTVQGMFRLLLSSAHMICERVISVLSFFIPRRVPAVQVDHVQIDSEGNRTPTPSRSQSYVDFSAILGSDESHECEERSPRTFRSMVNPHVRRNLSASFSDTE